MKVKGWIHIVDNGDGSASPVFYRTRKEAEASAAREMEEYGEALCDNIEELEIEVDDDGFVISEK